MSIGLVVAILISGFFTGGLARFALPGPDPMPIWLTVAIGLVGSIVGAIFAETVLGGSRYAVSIISFVVALALVAAYRHFVQRRPIIGPGALRFPERGIGVEQYRERMRRIGLDPDRDTAISPGFQRKRLVSALDELRAAGVIDDEEYAAKRALLEQDVSEVS